MAQALASEISGPAEGGAGRAGWAGGAWPRDDGIRIDHLLLSPQAADRLKNIRIDRHVRGWERPSDHVPVAITLA